MTKREKKGGFDHYLDDAFKKDPHLELAYLAELAKEPIGTQIAVLRHRMGLTQEQVAKRMHLKQSHVARLERKGENPTVRKVNEAAKALGCRVIMIPEKDLKQIIAKTA